MSTATQIVFQIHSLSVLIIPLLLDSLTRQFSISFLSRQKQQLLLFFFFQRENEIWRCTSSGSYLSPSQGSNCRTPILVNSITDPPTHFSIMRDRMSQTNKFSSTKRNVLSASVLYEQSTLFIYFCCNFFVGLVIIKSSRFPRNFIIEKKFYYIRVKAGKKEEKD